MSSRKGHLQVSNESGIEESFTTTLNDNDVLMGRGSPSTEYSGNLRFRQLVLERRETYLQCTRRNEKHQIAKEIIGTIHQRGGRFLVRITTMEEAERLRVPPRTQAWKIMPASRALFVKVKQLMRDVGEETQKKRKIRREEKRGQIKKPSIDASKEKNDSKISPKRSKSTFEPQYSSSDSEEESPVHASPYNTSESKGDDHSLDEESDESSCSSGDTGHHQDRGQTQSSGAAASERAKKTSAAAKSQPTTSSVQNILNARPSSSIFQAPPAPPWARQPSSVGGNTTSPGNTTNTNEPSATTATLTAQAPIHQQQQQEPLQQQQQQLIIPLLLAVLQHQQHQQPQNLFALLHGLQAATNQSLPATPAPPPPPPTPSIADILRNVLLPQTTPSAGNNQVYLSQQVPQQQVQRPTLVNPVAGSAALGPTTAGSNNPGDSQAELNILTLVLRALQQQQSQQQPPR